MQSRKVSACGSADRLADKKPAITWTVSRFQDEIGPADTVFLWMTGPDRGIRAVLCVDDGPRVMAELESEQEYWVKRDTEQLTRVVCTITNREVNLSAIALRQVEGLDDLSVFHGFQQATNFPVTREQGEIILRLIGQTTCP